MHCFIAGVCPVLCSGHGQYGGGICHCEESWKGPECDIPEGDCRIADCSGHGKCVRGFCQCKPGWKGNYFIPDRFYVCSRFTLLQSRDCFLRIVTVPVSAINFRLPHFF